MAVSLATEMAAEAGTAVAVAKAKATDTLNELKSYLRIDHDYDDAQLKMLMDAGREYLTNAGAVDDDGSLFRLALMLYVATHYENRDGSYKTDGYSHALQSIILQLKVKV